MPTKHKGLHEERTRVICHLPLNDQREENAFFKVIDYINQLRHQNLGVSGYTHSIVRPTVFRGFWWPDGADSPVEDRMVMVTIDYLLAFGAKELGEKVRELKLIVRKSYREQRSSQDEVWVVAYPIMRQD